MSKASSIVEKLRKEKKIDVSLITDDNSSCTVTEWVSTGCLALDAIMGGGLPVGRIVEMFGDPSSGKSLIGAQVAAVAQEMGALVGYIDTESAASPEMMNEVGVDTSNMIYYSPDTVEEVFEFCEELVEMKDKDQFLLLVWDSIAATSAKAEMESDVGKANYGLHAKLLSQGLRKFARMIAKERVSLLALNQIRDNIGVVFGDKVATFGGKGLKFYSSVRVQLDLTNKISVPHKKRKRILGMNTRAVVVKNKVAMPFREAILPIYFGHGIDDEKASLLYLQEMDMVKTGGSWYKINIDGKEEKFQKTTWAEFYDQHYDQIADLIMESTKNGYTDAESDNGEEE